VLLKVRVELLGLGIGAEPEDLHGSGEDVTGNALLIHTDASLPGDIPNGLVIAARGLPLNEDSLIAAVRLLKTHTDHKDDSFFARRGLKDARDFYAQYLHLSGIFVLDEATAPARAVFSPNREARHPLSKEAVTVLMQRLTSAGGTS
jgi:hypothetical protein